MISNRGTASYCYDTRWLGRRYGFWRSFLFQRGIFKFHICFRGVCPNLLGPKRQVLDLVCWIQMWWTTKTTSYNMTLSNISSWWPLPTTLHGKAKQKQMSMWTKEIAKKGVCIKFWGIIIWRIWQDIFIFGNSISCLEEVVQRVMEVCVCVSLFFIPAFGQGKAWTSWRKSLKWAFRRTWSSC